jgi:hypothetical protein
MNNYNVLFDTRNRNRACSTSFNVAASSKGEAVAIAMNLLKKFGENPTNFKQPKVVIAR